MTLEEPQNHRTRVAAERREKTRVLGVFAQKGPQAVFDDVIAQAGMASIRAEIGVKCGHDYFETRAVTCIRPVRV